MKIDKLGKEWTRTIAIALCAGYLGLKLKGYTGSLAEMTWGMTVFFACIYWFSEVKK